MISVCILYEDNKVWIKFDPVKFRALLKEYFEKYKSIDMALDKIIEEIKSETQNK